MLFVAEIFEHITNKTNYL